MLSYEKRMDLARRFIYDCNITDNKTEQDSYIVKDVAEVLQAYAKDIEELELYDNEPLSDIQRVINDYFSDDSVESFLNRHNINWE